VRRTLNLCSTHVCSIDGVNAKVNPCAIQHTEPRVVVWHERTLISGIDNGTPAASAIVARSAQIQMLDAVCSVRCALHAVSKSFLKNIKGQKS
jgi:hypothetical protein